MENFELGALLGAGTTGSVFRAKVKSSGKIVALKIVALNQKTEALKLTDLARIPEIQVHTLVRDVHIISLLHWFVQNDCADRGGTKICLVFECMDNTLLQLIETYLNSKLCYFQRIHRTRSFMYQLLCGINSLHSKGIIHRDVKPSNLLVQNNVLKICDFGLAAITNTGNRIKSSFNAEIATRWYRAPELLMHNPYSFQVDLWSAGCIFAELVTGKPLFPGEDEDSQLTLVYDIIQPSSKNNDQIRKNIRSVVPGLSHDGYHLLESLLQWEPGNRPTAAEAMRFLFFDCDLILHQLMREG